MTEATSQTINHGAGGAGTPTPTPKAHGVLAAESNVEKLDPLASNDGE
ncbi:hypothetical protein OZX74_03580 [Bifidobacterium sp. ESL0798]|nr:hypothetical protein [Bifidobacterium sp. ESL0798]WEV74612.1 hypothetical protein OZX74_03580 [Bifidobacterium sp. ESL0798]